MDCGDLGRNSAAGMHKRVQHSHDSEVSIEHDNGNFDDAITLICRQARGFNVQYCEPGH
jgi:hypothetical protein